MELEEIEVLDLKPGQRIELILNTSIGYNHQPLPDNKTCNKMVYYQGLVTSEHGTKILKYHEATGYSLDGKCPIEGSNMLPLINKISLLEAI